jgi:microcystin-dependent protein
MAFLSTELVTPRPSYNVTIPTGTVKFFHSNTAPTGWVICDGGLLNKTENPDLFAQIGYTYGFCNTKATPIMTSATAPSGFVYQSSQYDSTNYQGWRAFDGVLTDQWGWLTPQGTLTGWLCYKFTAAKTLLGYTVKPGYHGTAYNYINTIPSTDNSSQNTTTYPKTWTFQGSNNTTNGSDGTWVTLDTQNILNWSYGETKIFKIATPQSFIAYRINVSASNGTPYYLSIIDLGLYDINDVGDYFKLPDLRGEFIRGYDGTRGVDGNRILGSWQSPDIRQHYHTLNSGMFAYNYTYAVNQFGYISGGVGDMSGSTTTWNGGTKTTPRSIAYLPCIKL